MAEKIKVELNLQRMPFKSGGRRVALLLVNEKGKVCVHRKIIYPPGIYRIPTGTVEKNEKEEDAVKREVKEEFGIKVKKSEINKVAEIHYLINMKGQKKTYTESVYLIKVEESKLKPNEKEIGEIKFVPMEELLSIYRKLKWLKGEWKYWGKFRSVLHRIVYNLYKQGELGF